MRLLLNTEVRRFDTGTAEVATAGQRETLRRDVAFVLIGAEPPTSFLKRLGVAFTGEWTLRLLPKLAWVFALVYTIYCVKAGLWPFKPLY